MKLNKLLSEQEYNGYLKSKVIEMATQNEWVKLKDFINQEIDDNNIKQSEIPYVHKEQPEYFKSGYKIRTDGVKAYRLRYICPKCYHTGNHYIPEGTEEITCHECNHVMETRSIQQEYKVLKDNFNNYYYAGDYYPKGLY